MFKDRRVRDWCPRCAHFLTSDGPERAGIRRGSEQALNPEMWMRASIVFGLGRERVNGR